MRSPTEATARKAAKPKATPAQIRNRSSTPTPSISPTVGLSVATGTSVEGGEEVLDATAVAVAVGEGTDIDVAVAVGMGVGVAVGVPVGAGDGMTVDAGAVGVTVGARAGIEASPVPEDGGDNSPDLKATDSSPVRLRYESP
jgi:hypothetical protein